MNIDQFDHQHRIDEIERELLRDDPALGKQFARLDQVNRRHDATVFMLIVSSVVFLMIGLVTMSALPWLLGVIGLVASFSVDTRHERELREFRRTRERRPRRHPVGFR